MGVIGPRWRWVAFVLCLGAVMYGMFRPEPPPEVFTHSDKWGHVLAFLGLAVTGRLALQRWPVWIFWPVMLALAPLLEWLQGATRPLRWFSLGDAAANVAGVFLAMLLLGLWVGVTRTRCTRLVRRGVAETVT